MDINRTLTNEASRTLQVGAVTFEYLIVPQSDYVEAGLLAALGHFAQEVGLLILIMCPQKWRPVACLVRD